MSRKLWIISVIIILAGILSVIMAIKFYRQGLNFVRPFVKRQKVPSMVRALPFKKKIPRRQKPLIVRNLKTNQILLTDVLATPAHAPKGTYLVLSLVLDFSSTEMAQRYAKQKPLLEETIINCVQRIDYRDLRSSEGVTILKKALEKAFKKILKDKMTALWVAEYSFQRIKRL